MEKLDFASAPKPVAASASAFGLHPRLAIRHTRGNANETWELECPDGNWMLKISPGDDGPELERRASVAASLRDAGAPVVAPRNNASGTFACETGDGRFAVAYSKFEGSTHVAADESDPRAETYGAIGQALAGFHSAAARCSNLRRKRKWFEQDNCFNLIERDRYSLDRPGIVGIYDRRRAVCLELAGGENPRDVIHCDLHFDNIVISPDGSDVRFCDIDDVCLGARAMDLAMIAFDLGVILRSERPGPAVAGRVDAVLGAYADASGTRYSLADLLPWVELLEVAVFLQCTDFDYSGDDEEDWGVRFMKGRESRLERGIPYFDAL